MTNLSTSAESNQLRNMLKVAQEIGCQIQPGIENPNILTGLCPFHEARTLHDAKTLHVNLGNTRFWCISCHASGYPLAFIARIWGVTASDAYRFLREGREITADRPRPRRPGDGTHRNVTPQNSALLTMATQLFGRQAKQSYPALHYLARLGIEPEAAIRAGFGYCSGEGLAEHLERMGADPGEIRESPLFQDITGMEFLSGCITLSDLDFTDATVWIAGLLPEEDSRQAWNQSKPRMRSIRGKRNRFFNSTNIMPNEQGVTVTDDPRLYLVMKAEGMTPVLFNSQRLEGNGRRLAAGAAAILMSREPGSLVFAMHDREMQRILAERAAEILPRTGREHRSREEMLKQLAFHTRDLREFTRARGRAQEAPGRTETPERPQADGSPTGGSEPERSRRRPHERGRGRNGANPQGKNWAGPREKTGAAASAGEEVSREGTGPGRPPPPDSVSAGT